MARSLVPLDILASNLSAGIGDSSGKWKFTFLRHLLSGYRECNLFLGSDFEVKTAILEYDNSIAMPSDFVFETKVGVLYNGVLAVLTLDKSVSCQKLNQTQSQEYLNSIWSGGYTGGDAYPFYNCFRGSNYLGELYGYGRGIYSAGFYNIDRKEGVINIGSLVPVGAEIVIEYKSDGISEGLKLVPTEMEMTLSYWAKARFYEERQDKYWASYNQAEYEKNYNKTKRLYNFRSSLYMGAKLQELSSGTNY